MNRLEFLKLSSAGTIGLIASPTVFLSNCSGCSEDSKWLFDLTIEGTAALAEMLIYPTCLAAVKNPAICKGVSVIGTAVIEMLKDPAKDFLKDVVNGIQYSVNRAGDGIKIVMETLTIDDALDATARTDTWSYLSGLGYYPKVSRILQVDTKLADLDSEKLSIMRNEMYARHGYKFHKKKEAYFGTQKWYKNIKEKSYDAEYIYFNQFIEVERQNVGIIDKVEKYLKKKGR